MDKHSDRSLAQGATHTVVYDRSSRRHDKDEEDLPPEDMGKGYMVPAPPAQQAGFWGLGC